MRRDGKGRENVTGLIMCTPCTVNIKASNAMGLILEPRVADGDDTEPTLGESLRFQRR